jgi:hypothetical protein
MIISRGLLIQNRHTTDLHRLTKRLQRDRVINRLHRISRGLRSATTVCSKQAAGWAVAVIATAIAAMAVAATVTAAAVVTTAARAAVTAVAARITAIAVKGVTVVPAAIVDRVTDTATPTAATATWNAECRATVGLARRGGRCSATSCICR